MKALGYVISRHRRCLFAQQGRVLSAFFVGCWYFCSIAPALGQHSIDVQRSVAKEEFFEALKLYEKMPKRKATLDAVVAAARAAWALSLPDRAIEELELALRTEKIDPILKSRLFLSRGIIEYQEGRYQVALLYAEKATEGLDGGSPLRARAWLLWGESLLKLDSFGKAETKFTNALEEVRPEEQAHVHYMLGVCQLKLGKIDQAREHFEQIPLDSDDTPMTIRYLAMIALDQGNYQQADFWLKRGRAEFPEAFLDSWVDYALTQAAVQLDNLEEVRVIQTEASQKYPPSDHWLTLLQAAVEAYEWRRSNVVVSEN